MIRTLVLLGCLFVFMLELIIFIGLFTCLEAKACNTIIEGMGEIYYCPAGSCCQSNGPGTSSRDTKIIDNVCWKKDGSLDDDKPSIHYFYCDP